MQQDIIEYFMGDIIMDLHFLISISSASENLFGVRFLCSFLQPFSDCKVTLFHIGSGKGASSAAMLMNMWENPDGQQNVQPDTAAAKAMAQAEKLLEDANFCKDALQTKTVRERYGKIRDILGEAANGLYDALILGRRASYALQWMFERPADEIPQAMIRDAALSSPLWLCTEPEEGRQNVLLCIDGSSSGLRTADHVGYILSCALRHHVTLFHVTMPMQPLDNEIFERPIEILQRHTISMDRIQVKTVTGLSVVNAILAEENRGNYAAIAVGLNGITQMVSLKSPKGVGKTTSSLITKMGKAAIWCCP